MAEFSESGTTTPDCFDQTISDTNRPERNVTVKFSTKDGKVFTQSYADYTTIGEIKFVLTEVFAVPSNSIVICKDMLNVSDNKPLNQFELGEYNILEFQLFSSDLEYVISADAAYEHFSMPDVITVRVDDSDEEDGYRDVVVEIINSAIKKPFIGGYMHKESGIEYHNAYSQTGPPPSKVPPQNKNHRDTQTYWLRNRLLDTNYARATQMTNEETWIPNVTDKIITSGPYETAEEWEKRRDVENKVITIQRYFRAWKTRRILKELSAEYQKRIRLEKELEEFNAKDFVDGKKRELISKVFPRTKTDFYMLFGMVDRWKKAEIKRITDCYTGAAKIAAFYVLLDKEVQMLRAIENHRERLKKDLRVQKQREFFKTIANPIAWNHRFKTWTDEYKKLYIEMDTLETQQGREYYNMYLSIADDNAAQEDRLQALLNIKLLLHDHNCQLSNELVSLIDRACELIVRGLKNKHIDMLMKRIQGMLIRHIKSPECSFGVTNRMVRVKEKLMQDNLYYCNRCEKLKAPNEFVINTQIDKLRVCAACSWIDRVMEPWIDLGPYCHMLQVIRRDECMKQSASLVPFMLEPKDLHYIVETIWHSRSALTETTNVYNLRLCRFFRDLPWTPWNCILLTHKEAKTHLDIPKVQDVYDRHFLYRVFNKHELAKVHFRIARRADREFQEFDEYENKWNELFPFIEFVPVNSKPKLLPKCH